MLHKLLLSFQITVNSHRKIALQKLGKQNCKGNILLSLNPFVIRPHVIHHASSCGFCLNNQSKKFLELNTVLHYRRPHAGGPPWCWHVTSPMAGWFYSGGKQSGRRYRKSRVPRGLRTHSLLVTDHNTASLGQLNLILNFRDIPNITLKCTGLTSVCYFEVPFFSRGHVMESMHPTRSERVQLTPAQNVKFFVEHWTFFIIGFICYKCDSTALCYSQTSISFYPYSLRVCCRFKH